LACGEVRQSEKWLRCAPAANPTPPRPRRCGSVRVIRAGEFHERFGSVMYGVAQRRQVKARNFGAAVDPDSEPVRAQAAICIDVKIAVAIQPGVKLFANPE
jgi:hypothetical protein